MTTPHHTKRKRPNLKDMYQGATEEEIPQELVCEAENVLCDTLCNDEPYKCWILRHLRSTSRTFRNTWKWYKESPNIVCAFAECPSVRDSVDYRRLILCGGIRVDIPDDQLRLFIHPGDTLDDVDSLWSDYPVLAHNKESFMRIARLGILPVFSKSDVLRFLNCNEERDPEDPDYCPYDPDDDRWRYDPDVLDAVLSDDMKFHHYDFYELDGTLMYLYDWVHDAVPPCSQKVARFVGAHLTHVYSDWYNNMRLLKDCEPLLMSHLASAPIVARCLGAQEAASEPGSYHWKTVLLVANLMPRRIGEWVFANPVATNWLIRNRSSGKVALFTQIQRVSVSFPVLEPLMHLLITEEDVRHVDYSSWIAPPDVNLLTHVSYWAAAEWCVEKHLNTDPVTKIRDMLCNDTPVRSNVVVDYILKTRPDTVTDALRTVTCAGISVRIQTLLVVAGIRVPMIDPRSVWREVGWMSKRFSPSYIHMWLDTVYDFRADESKFGDMKRRGLPPSSIIDIMCMC